MGSFREKVAALYGWIMMQSKRYYSYNSLDRDDLANDTILKMFEAENSFDESRDLKPWACAIMRNTFVTQRNRRSCIEFECLECCKGDDVHTDDVADCAMIMAFIRRVSERNMNMRCLMLRIEGYSYCEIAELMSIPIGTVKSRINTARRFMKKALH